MTNIKKVLCIMLALMLVFSVFSFTVFADDFAGDSGDMGGGDDTGDMEVIDDGGDTGGGEEVVPQDNTPVDDGNAVADDNNSYQEEPYYGNYVEDNGGAAQQPQYNDVITETSNLYDTSDIDKSALAANKWSNIEMPTQSGKSKTVVDFSAIQKDTGSEDNGEWILWVGFILVGLSLCGIAYFILATVSYKKKLNNLTRREAKNKQYHDEHKNREAAAKRKYAHAAPSSSNSHYASDSRLSYKDRKRLKEDTAEIYVPKRYAKR